MFTGIYAPFILGVVALVLFFYKAVYTEVVEALPINGGVYNCLLNATSKTLAAIAGVTTILSFVATTVISAKVAIEYLGTLFHIPVVPFTGALLLIVALLVKSGIKDSSRVALGIFIFHIISLLLFFVLGLIHFLQNNSYLIENLLHTSTFITRDGMLKALFFGFSASLLGISGFESSANFIEEQQPGVFRKTLRNMLVGVAIINPLVALVALNTAPISQIVLSKEFLLADLAKTLGGTLFQNIIVLDAYLVLLGAVITSFVGVSGLMYRMATDACLPEFLTKINRNGSYPRIIATFFLLCVSILFITKGNLLSLAGVYTIAFLGVMSLFALGNLLLRETRTELKRTYHAPILLVFLALASTTFGIFGNVLMQSHNLWYFMIYFIPAVFIVLIFVYLDYAIKFLMRITKPIPKLHSYFQKNFEDVTSGTIVAFINHVHHLHQILKYINRNETALRIILVHCKNWDNKPDLARYREIERVIPVLQEAGVFPYFHIQLIYKDQPFGPDVIHEVSKELKVRKNRIMIGSIHDFHEFDYADLDGVRIIL